MNHCRDCLWWKPNRPDFEDVNKDPQMCTNLKIYVPVLAELGCDFHLAANSVEVNVPQHTAIGAMIDPNPNPVDGPVHILIVTYWKDFPWLKYCLRSIEKFCSGFHGATIAVPNKDLKEAFSLIYNTESPARWRLYGYDEIPGKGMLQHMVKMAEADLILPSTTKYVLTCDADCIFRMPTTPEHYFWNDKPYYIWRSWASLTVEDPRNPGSKVVSDCLQWKAPTDRQVGFDTEMFGMCMNTVVFPIDFFKKYRAHIESVHNRPFEEFMLDGRNEFPQSNMDFTAMGAYAFRHMRDRWHWFDVAQPPYPEDRKRAYWSHGGITPQFLFDMQELLK